MITKIKIPEERIPVVIGRNGSTKRLIEESIKTRLTINDEITIEGEALPTMTAENIIRAIGRGFSPETAMELLDEEVTLFVIPLPKERKHLVRVKARIIGAQGKAKRNIERLTGTKIAIYGKTVSVLGKYENAEMTKEAIEMLVRGSSHKIVYRFLGERHA